MRINLLPPEVHDRQRGRRRTAAVVAIGLIVLAAIGGFYVLQILRLSDVEDDIDAQAATNAQLQGQINELQEIAQLQTEIDNTRQLLDGLLADRVLWSGVLRDVSLVIPGQTWLSGFTGSVGVPGTTGVPVTTTTTGTTGAPTTTTAPAPTAGAPATGGLIGQISFNGFAFGHRDVALWLSRLEDVRGFVNPWLSTSSKTMIDTTEVVQFTNSVDLSEQALARRAGGAS